MEQLAETKTIASRDAHTLKKIFRKYYETVALEAK